MGQLNDYVVWVPGGGVRAVDLQWASGLKLVTFVLYLFLSSTTRRTPMDSAAG